MTEEKKIDGQTIEELRGMCKQWSLVLADDLMAADRLKQNLEKIDADRASHGLPMIDRDHLWPFDLAIDLIQVYLGEQGLPRLTWEQIAELGEVDPEDLPDWLEKRRGRKP